jgi:hypothetical protein
MSGCEKRMTVTDSNASSWSLETTLPVKQRLSAHERIYTKTHLDSMWDHDGVRACFIDVIRIVFHSGHCSVAELVRGADKQQIYRIVLGN